MKNLIAVLLIAGLLVACAPPPEQLPSLPAVPSPAAQVEQAPAGR